MINKRLSSIRDYQKKLDKIHRLLHPLLQDLLNPDPLRLRQPGTAGTPRTGSSTVRSGQVIVMLPGPVGHQVGVVGGGGEGDGAGAPAVEVTEVVGQGLQLVRRKVAERRNMRR